MRTEIDLQNAYSELPVELARTATGKSASPVAAASPDLHLGRFFLDGVWISLRYPLQALSFLRIARNQVRSARIRAGWERRGVRVPPIILYSVTNRCNLHCKGCYHHALHASCGTEMSDVNMKRVVEEASELGVSSMVFAGGEPMVRKGLLNITAQHPEMVFFIFTNGTLIDDAVTAKLRRQRNVVPLISLEGIEKDTDTRRGPGIHGRVMEVMARLRRGHVFFGTSITMTSRNFSTVADDIYVKSLAKLGCKLFLYVGYTPVEKGTEDWIITDEQREETGSRMAALRAKNHALFVSVPGDEEELGGCLAAGKGFVHISAEGNVEPCPFSPYSDSNLTKVPLRVALQSEFLRKIRESNEGTEEGRGGCALWEKREWVQSLLAPAAAPAATDAERECCEEELAGVGR